MAAFIKRITGLIDGTGSHRERMARRAISAAVAISILVHVLALWRMPSFRLPSSEFAEKQSGPLIVQLVPPPAPPAAPPARPPRTKPPPAPPQARVGQPPPQPPARRAEPPAPRPPVLARPEPA